MVHAPTRTWRKPLRLYGAVAHDLAESIIHGRYGPNDYLPTEQALATEYGTSRNVVREALRVLSARGMIDVQHGKGSQVLPRHQWQLVDQLVHLVREDQRVPQDLLELRRILEVEIAGLAADRASSEQTRAMRGTIEQMQASHDDPTACIEHDIAFHELLAAAAGNALLPLVLNPISHLLRASRLATIQNAGAVDRSVAAHEDVLDRVEAHDAAGAREAMQRHLVQVEGEIRRVRTDSRTTQRSDAPS